MTEDLWHTPLVHIRGRDVRGDTGQTSGMTRLEAISGKSCRLVQALDGPDPRRPGDQVR